MSLVYQPEEDSLLLESVIRRYVKNKTVLDMCTGTGILAQEALKSKAKSVTAVDINKDALTSIKEKSIKKIKSNLFKNVSGKFDIILCNPPYLPEDKKEDKESRLATTGGKKGDEFILRFLKQAKKHLENNGTILLLVSSLTPMNRINLLLNKLRFQWEIAAEKKLFFEKIYVLKIKSL